MQMTHSAGTRRLERLHSKFTSSLPFSGNFNLRLSLTERRTFHTALQVFKIVNRISPPYLHGVFSFAVDVTGRSSRNVHRLYVPSVRTNFGKRKRSLAYTGAQPSGTDYHQHFMVLKLCQNLRNCIACCNFVLCMYVCTVSYSYCICVLRA